MPKPEILVRFVPLGNNPLHDPMDDHLAGIAAAHGAKEIDTGTWFDRAHRPLVRENFYRTPRRAIATLKSALEREPGILSVRISYRYGAGYVDIHDDPPVAAALANRA
jgi:hypothetical protein